MFSDFPTWDQFWEAVSGIGTTLGRDWMERMHSPARRRVQASRLYRWLSARRVRRFVHQVKTTE